MTDTIADDIAHLAEAYGNDWLEDDLMWHPEEVAIAAFEGMHLGYVYGTCGTTEDLWTNVQVQLDIVANESGDPEVDLLRHMESELIATLEEIARMLKDREAV